MTTPIQNVTPPGRPGAARPPAARSPRQTIVVVLAIALIFFGIRAVFFHANRYERLASDVTKAIAANDMRPVEKEFNALRRPQLEDRAKVGQLSDFINELGAFRGVKEDTPKDAAPRSHHFVAHFERGNRVEDLTVDADGKIADFHVKPEPGP